MKSIAIITAFVLTIGTGQLHAQEKPMTAYMVADAHLDTQWNWDVQATIKTHIWNTMIQNFRLFELYPNYVFKF